MKKLLLLAATTAVLSTSAFADEGMVSSKSGFYARGDFGAFLNNKRNIETVAAGVDVNIKAKSRAVALLDLGIGYNINEQFRAELVYTHLFNPELKGSVSAVHSGHTLARTVRAKAKVDALMVNGIFDIYDFGAGKLFMGAGIGVAQVSEKVNVSDTVDWQLVDSGSIKFKKKNNFAYNLMAGSSFILADGLNLDVQYRWADYGTAKYGKNDDDIEEKRKLHRRGNAVKVGLRFDI